MPDFVCRLGTASGEVVERVFSEDSEAELRRKLGDQEFLILSIRRKLGLALPFAGRRRRIPASDFLAFNQELMALIRAGLPILGSLDMLIERRKNPTFRQALIEVRDHIRAGGSLSEGFAAQGDLFPALYSTSLASGERSGEIATVLKRYIAYTQNIAAVRKRILSAAIYPIILTFVMAVVIYIMIGHVFPQFTEFFETMKADLPLPTQILLGFSRWMEHNRILALGIVAALITAAVLFRRTPKGREFIDRHKITLPLVGVVFQKYAITRFTRTLGTLLAGGLPMVTALQISSKVVGNSAFSNRLDEVARKVREGQPLWSSLEATGFMSDLSLEMIRVGESTGAMTEMLDNVSEFYEKEIETRIATLLSLLEPVLLLAMAVVIGGLLLAIYMPLLSSFSSAGI
jgi:type IV pilus assembly protein PilC